MEQCHVSCVFECITFTSVCGLTQGSTSAKKETSTITSCPCGMMYVNDNLWLAMLTFKKAQAVSGIYFTRTSCYVIGKSLCKYSVFSVTKVCYCSFFLLAWTNYKLSKHISALKQEPPGMLVETFRQERSPKWAENNCFESLLFDVCSHQDCSPGGQSRKCNWSTSPIKETFHLEQPWLEMLTVLLLCRAPVLFPRGKTSTHQNSSKLIQSLDGCLGLC